MAVLYEYFSRNQSCFSNDKNKEISKQKICVYIFLFWAIKDYIYRKFIKYPVDRQTKSKQQ